MLGPSVGIKRLKRLLPILTELAATSGGQTKDDYLHDVQLMTESNEPIHGAAKQTIGFVVKWHDSIGCTIKQLIA